MVDKIVISFKRSTLEGLGCEQLNSLVNLLNYACTVRGNQEACRQLDFVKSIASSKGCTI